MYRANFNVFFLCIVAFACTLESCQIGHEVHYFKSGPNYYRIKINQSSFASKARYMSGFYDENAVDKYFSEMSQPHENDSTLAANVSFISPSSNGQASKLKIDSNKQFVMILSSNSNAVSEQIGAFAENEIILESIARIANKGKIEESEKYASEIINLNARNKRARDLGDQFITSLSDSATLPQLIGNLNTFLEFLKINSAGNITSIELLQRSLKRP